MKQSIGRLASVFEYVMVFVLVSASVYLLAQSNTLGKAHAAGEVVQYSSDWTVTKMVGAILPQQASSASGAKPQVIAIGPAQWVVKGTYGNSAYKETWNVPGDGNVSISIGKLADSQCRFDYRQNKDVCGKDYLGVVAKSGDYNEGDWLISYVGDNTDSMTFFTNGVPSTFGGTDSWPKETYGNGAMKCTVSNGGDTNCTYASGMYGVTQAESIDAARGSSQISRSGTFMPLKWKVTGTICTDKNDAAACQ